jgi:hypothetical protein
MVNCCLRSGRRSHPIPLLLAFVATTLLICPNAAGQPVTPGAASSQARLKAAIDARYRAYTTQGGILLVPRSRVTGVESIEVLESTIGINGAIVTGAELRQRLGADADAIIALSYLEPAARQALLFGLAPGPPSPPVPPVVTPEVPVPAPSPTQPQVLTPKELFRRRAEARVRVGGSVHVASDEVVDGAVVAVLGSATIDGEVRDDVVVVAGNARLGPEANVRGDVTVVGGTLDVDPTARIGGSVNEIGFDVPQNWHFRPFPAWTWPIHPFRNWWTSPAVSLFVLVLRILLFGLLALVLLVAAPAALGRIERRVTAEPWKCGLVGLVAQLLFVPLLVLTIVILAVSIIGIPLLLLIPFALLALLFALLVGFAGVAGAVGRWVQERFGLGPKSRGMALVVGLTTIWALTLVGHLVALGGWPVWGLAAIFSAVGFVVEYLAWTVGFGAALMTRFGTRPAGEAPTSPEPHFEPPPSVDPSLVDVDLK